MGRGKLLKERMDEALKEDAWTELHGQFEVPKRYVPPFLQATPGRDQRGKGAAAKDGGDSARMENLYTMEIEEKLDRQR